MNESTAFNDQDTQFRNTRILLVPGDGEMIIASQAADGPVYIQIGRRCSDEYIFNTWAARQRFADLSLEEMLAIRDGKGPLQHQRDHQLQ